MNARSRITIAPRERKLQLAVIGAAVADATVLAQAEAVGRELAEAGAVLICGGRGGVMEAASRGAKKGGGLTIGVLPGATQGEANRYVDVPILTGLGEARNAIVAASSEVLVAIAGEYGTLSEIALALKMGRPVVGLHTWPLAMDVIRVENPEQAIEKVLDALGKR